MANDSESKAQASLPQECVGDLERDFSARLRAFRQELESEALELDPDEIFAGVRDPSPGREFSW